MKTDLASRIRSRLDALGKNPSGVALEAGLGRSSVRDILNGRSGNSRIDTLRKLTTPLQCSLDYLTGATEDPHGSDESNRYWWEHTQPIGRTRVSEAGVFRPQALVHAQLNEPTEGPRSAAHILYPDPRLPNEDFRLWEVGDDSLTSLNISKGDIATIAAIDGNNLNLLSNGNIIACVRYHVAMQAEESSLRIVELSDDEIRLTCGLNSEIAPIVLKISSLDEDRGDATGRFAFEGGTLQIEGIVVRITRSLPIGGGVYD